MLALYRRVVDAYHVEHLEGMLEMLFMLTDEICKKRECHADVSINSLFISESYK